MLQRRLLLLLIPCLLVGTMIPVRAGEEWQSRVIGPERSVESIAADSYGRWLVAGSKNDTRLWNLKANDPLAKCTVLRGSPGPISSDGQWLVTMANQQVIWVWNLKTDDPSEEGLEVARCEAIWKSLLGVAIGPNKRWLVTLGGDKVMRLWDLKANGETARPRILMERQGGFIFSTPDGRWLTTGSPAGKVGVWDLAADDPVSKAIVQQIKRERGYAGPQGISPDGRWLVTADPNRRLWDLRAKEPFARHVAEFGGTENVRSLDFSPDCLWLVTGGDDGETRVYDLKKTDPWPKPRELGGHAKDSGVGEVRFTPNGRWLVTGGRNETARLWEMKATGFSPKSVILGGHKGWVEFLSVSPDSRWLVTGASVPNQEFDGAARLWDLKSADPSDVRAVLGGHGGALQDAIFSSDGRWLVTRASDQTARLWDLKAANR
jgi:WD40 repeat protein